MDSAAWVSRRVVGLPLVLPRLGAAAALTALIGVSAVVRSVASWHKATPAYLPDEYLYAELARSLTETGRPLVRGADAGFPALLQPVLTAPLWVVDDVAVAYHLVQVLATLAMSLAAVPVYVLARRLGLGSGLAVGCAALTLAVPDFLYAGWILAEPFAYPLALASVAAGTLALADGGRRRQVLFLALAGLTVLARVQFVVLLPAYAAAAIVLGLRERALRRVAREQLLPLGLVGLGLAAGVARPSLVGLYQGFLDIDLGPQLAARMAKNAFGLAYAGGWLLVPGALLGLALALARPRSRRELAFAALAGWLGLGLLAEAAAYGSLGRVQERYFFYALPLLGLLFALYASRGWPHRLAYGALAAGAVAAVALVPLSSMTAALEKMHSPFLLAASRLEHAVGGPGQGSLVLALTASVLVAATLVCASRGRVGTALTLVLATSFCALASFGATVFDLESSAWLRARALPADRSWIDRAGLDDVALLLPFSPAGETHVQLFWNRSVTSLLLLDDGQRSDQYRVDHLSIGPDGTLLDDGQPVARPVVVDEFAGRVSLRGAVPVARAPMHRLWRPDGAVRLELVTQGYFYDGELGNRGSFRLWPATEAGKLAGWMTFRATPVRTETLTVRSRSGRRTYRLAPGKATRVAIPVCVRGPWRAQFEADASIWRNGHFVSARATPPTWKPTPVACRTPRPRLRAGGDQTRGG
jgi:hypothetical protein